MFRSWTGTERWSGSDLQLKDSKNKITSFVGNRNSEIVNVYILLINLFIAFEFSFEFSFFNLLTFRKRSISICNFEFKEFIYLFVYFHFEVTNM